MANILQSERNYGINHECLRPAPLLGRFALLKLSQGVVPPVKATILIWSTRTVLSRSISTTMAPVMHDNKTSLLTGSVTVILLDKVFGK